MIVRTKKFAIDTKTYVKLGMTEAMKEFWWAWLVPLAIMVIPIFVEDSLGWCLGIAITLSILWVLFWWIQFMGATQMEQNKQMFDKMQYEISSQQILMKVNANQGMPIKWDMIQKAYKRKDAFVMVISRGQFLYFPYKVFTSEANIGFVDAILRRKGLIEEKKK